MTNVDVASAGAQAPSLPERFRDLSDRTRMWYARTYAHVLGADAETQESLRADDAAALAYFGKNAEILGRLIPEDGD